MMTRTDLKSEVNRRMIREYQNEQEASVAAQLNNLDDPDCKIWRAKAPEWRFGNWKITRGC